MQDCGIANASVQENALTTVGKEGNYLKLFGLTVQF